MPVNRIKLLFILFIREKPLFGIGIAFHIRSYNTSSGDGSDRGPSTEGNNAYHQAASLRKELHRGDRNDIQQFSGWKMRR